MKDLRAFFGFIVVLVVAGVGFGLYASTIQCGKSPLSPLECYRLYLAFGVLFAVAVMLAVAAAFYALVPPPADGADHPGKQIFDTMAKSLLPVVTLVLGYYFGSSQQGDTSKLRDAQIVSQSGNPPASPASPAASGQKK